MTNISGNQTNISGNAFSDSKGLIGVNMAAGDENAQVNQSAVLHCLRL
jgi:hypothetical protein